MRKRGPMRIREPAVLAGTPLHDYLMFIMSSPLMHLMPPAGGVTRGVVGTSEAAQPGILGIVLDRRGQFQTELFTVSPHIPQIDLHVHPEVESYELHVSGSFTFRSEGREFVQSANGSMLHSRPCLYIATDAAHGGTFKEGGAFLSFQQWRDGTTPSTVSDSWAPGL